MSEPPSSPIEFDADGLPRSRRYGDVYFSREGGLAESRAVFLAGCGLPERWAGRRRFVVGELGFGTGLNIAALLDLWRTHRPAGAHLSIFSVEAEPLAPDEARRALGAWPQLAPVAELLLARWPGRRAGFHRVDLPELGATLDLAVMDAAAALEAWSGAADAWFLDGFAPAANPRMWSDALMALVGRRSAPGALAATYTVAGQVRRALAAAGFAVEKRPGFGGKRERLVAVLPGPAAPEPPPPSVAIVGAGVAGASLARAFAALGLEAAVFDAAGRGAGASGNPAALVTPRLDAGLGPGAQLHAQAFARACRLYEQLGAPIIDRGVLQLEAAPRDARRFATIAASDLFEPGALAAASAEAVQAALGEPAAPGLRFRDALVIEPAQLLAAWLPQVQVAEVARAEPADGRWRLVSRRGDVVAQADVVCLAAGAGMGALWPDAPIVPMRGQLSWVAGERVPAAAWGAYVAPTRDGFMFGASYDRALIDTELRAEDEARNLAGLAARLPQLAARIADARIASAGIGGRAAIRATTSDHLPLAGEIAPGLFALGGLASRGYALAPLLAEHVAALATGAPSPLPAQLAPIVAPARFTVETARRLGAHGSAGVSSGDAGEGQVRSGAIFDEDPSPSRLRLRRRPVGERRRPAAAGRAGRRPAGQARPRLLLAADDLQLRRQRRQHPLRPRRRARRLRAEAVRQLLQPQLGAPRRPAELRRRRIQHLRRPQPRRRRGRPRHRHRPPALPGDQRPQADPAGSRRPAENRAALGSPFSGWPAEP
ncbi:MAG TPA: tRNA (5-methylaminomethyl-2-thiouridine)(34)-methyltransferase MnmD [Caulobacteraceae bacterium]